MDKNYLSEAIKKTGLSAQVKTVWLYHPLLEQMASEFASYVCMHTLAANGQSLLCVALKDALSKYKAAGEDEKEAVASFTRSLIAHSAEVFAQQVVVTTDRGDVAWSPFVCSLHDFLASYPEANVTAKRVETKIQPSIAKTFMMTKIIPHSLLDQNSLSELLNDETLTV